MNSGRAWPEVLCLFGLSGVGKTTLASQVAERRHWHLIELDQPGLATEWPPECVAAFTRFASHGDPGDFVDQLRVLAAGQGWPGVVVCFRSHDRIPPAAMDRLRALGVAAAVLRAGIGPCIEAYLARELARPRGLSLWHWIRHNTQAYTGWQDPAFDSWALDVMRPDGRRKPVEALLAELLGAEPA